MIRIIIMHEVKGFSAGALDLEPEFYILGETVAEIEARLPAALEAHCGQPVEYRIISRPEA